MEIKIGDRIRDVEDNDCYYEGIVVSLNPIKYRIRDVVWNGKKDDSIKGKLSGLNWWTVKKLENQKWVELRK